MILVKFVLILFLSFTFIVVTFSNRHQIGQKLFLISIYLCVFFFILVPDYATLVAHYVSIDSGAHLVMYLTLGGLSALVAVLYTKIRQQDKLFTLIVRAEAIKNSKKI